jgi:hypothetical protein
MERLAVVFGSPRIFDHKNRGEDTKFDQCRHKNPPLSDCHAIEHLQWGAPVRREDPCDGTSEGGARMGAGVYEINFEKSAVHECGATLLALLAYPQDDEKDSNRARLHASLCALGLRNQCKLDQNEITPVPMKPIYAFRSENEIAEDLRTLER